MSSRAEPQGAIEDYFAAQAAGGESLAQDEEDDELADELMADENEDQPGQTAGQGARTLGGQAADTSLPEGWGRQERRTGRIGDWSGDQPARRPGG